MSQFATQPRGTGNFRGSNGYRGGYHKHSRSYGGERQAPQPVKKALRVVRGTGDIFSFESPKAYAPLGYGSQNVPRVLRPQDFDTDAPLPIYPERPAQVLSKSLGATFDDTESQRPNGTLVRKLVNRDNKKNNPLNNFIQRTKNAQKELKLGNKSLSEIIAERAASAKLVAITEKMALATPQSVKRGRADAREPEESTKRIKREFKIKFDGEDSPEVNNDTVKPENVLRMVDQSLVETPEKNTTETPQAQARRYQDYYSSSYQPRGMQPGDGSPAVGSKYQRFAGDRRSMPADYSDPYRSGPSDASGFNQYEADYSTNRFNVPQFGDNRHNNIGRDYFTRSGRNGHTARVPPLSKATNYGDFNRGPQYDEFGRVPQSNNSFGPGHRRGHSVQNSDTSRYYSRGASQEYEDKWDRQDW